MQFTHLAQSDTGQCVPLSPDVNSVTVFLFVVLGLEPSPFPHAGQGCSLQPYLCPKFCGPSCLALAWESIQASCGTCVLPAHLAGVAGRIPHSQGLKGQLCPPLAR